MSIDSNTYTAGRIVMKFDLSVNALTAMESSSFTFHTVGNNSVADPITWDMEGGQHYPHFQNLVTNILVVT